MNKKNLLFLTGAGFSQAYLKNGSNTLSSFFLLEVIIKHDLFKLLHAKIFGSDPSPGLLRIQKIASKIWDNLTNPLIYSNVIYPPNFETLFYLLDRLCQMRNLRMIPNDPKQ